MQAAPQGTVNQLSVQQLAFFNEIRQTKVDQKFWSAVGTVRVTVGTDPGPLGALQP